MVRNSAAQPVVVEREDRQICQVAQFDGDLIGELVVAEIKLREACEGT